MLLAGVLWGTMGAAQKVPDQMGGVASTGAFRTLLGGVCLLVAAGRAARPRRSPGARSLGALLLGGVSVGAFQILFFASMRHIGVAMGTVLTIGSSPVFAGLIVWVRTRRRPATHWWVATATTVLGCALLNGGAPSGSAGSPAPGIAMALAAGASYALFAVVSKPLIAAAPAQVVMGWMLLVAAVVLLPFALRDDLSWLAATDGLAVALYLGVVTTAGGFLVFGLGLRWVSPTTAATLSLVEPLTAAVLGFGLLGEPLTAAMLAGVCLLFAGLAWTALRPV